MKLTPEQIKNWRKVMPLIYGINSNVLSDQDIEKFAQNMQNKITEATKAEEDKNGK